MFFVALFMNVKKTTRCTSTVAGLFHLLSPAVSACFFQFVSCAWQGDTRKWTQKWQDASFCLPVTDSLAERAQTLLNERHSNWRPLLTLSERDNLDQISSCRAYHFTLQLTSPLQPRQPLLIVSNTVFFFFFISSGLNHRWEAQSQFNYRDACGFILMGNLTWLFLCFLQTCATLKMTSEDSKSWFTLKIANAFVFVVCIIQKIFLC